MSEILFARLDEMTAAVLNLQNQISAIAPIDTPNIIALSLLDTSVGQLTQTASATFTKRVLLGTTAQITVTNGNGVSGNPTISLPTAITLSGITLTGGTFASPTLSTPTLGVATATSINKVAITAPATGSTLTIADGKTLTVSNSITFVGTDGTSMTFPISSDTVVGLAAAQTLTNKTLTSPKINVTSDATGDIYYRNSGGNLTRLAIGSATNVLAVSSGLPAWVAATSGGNVSNSGTPTANQLAQWTNSTTIQGFTPAIGTVQVFNTAGSGTYTPTAGVKWIKVRMVGGGGGGAGTGTSPGAPGNGTASTFNTTYTAPGGSGASSVFVGGLGGSLGVGDVTLAGTTGVNTMNALALAPSGSGGSSVFGGAGTSANNGTAGGNAGANSGSGGGGGSSATGFAAGAGGGSSSYTEQRLAVGTYGFVVGAKGLGGTAGTSGFAGGNGADGQIIVEEFYI